MESRMHWKVHVRFGGKHAKTCLWARRCVLSLRIPIFNILEDSCHVVVANPKYVRAIKGQKTDDKDSAWIADLFKFDIVPSSYIPCKEIRMLRELFRYRQKLIGHRSSEKTGYRMLLRFPTLPLHPSSQIPLENQRPPSLTISWPVRYLTPNTVNPCFLKKQRTRQMML